MSEMRTVIRFSTRYFTRMKHCNKSMNFNKILKYKMQADNFLETIESIDLILESGEVWRVFGAAPCDQLKKTIDDHFWQGMYVRLEGNGMRIEVEEPKEKSERKNIFVVHHPFFRQVKMAQIKMWTPGNIITGRSIHFNEGAIVSIRLELDSDEVWEISGNPEINELLIEKTDFSPDRPLYVKVEDDKLFIQVKRIPELDIRREAFNIAKETLLEKINRPSKEVDTISIKIDDEEPQIFTNEPISKEHEDRVIMGIDIAREALENHSFTKMICDGISKGRNTAAKLASSMNKVRLINLDPELWPIHTSGHFPILSQDQKDFLKNKNTGEQNMIYTKQELKEIREQIQKRLKNIEEESVVNKILKPEFQMKFYNVKVIHGRGQKLKLLVSVNAGPVNIGHFEEWFETELVNEEIKFKGLEDVFENYGNTFFDPSNLDLFLEHFEDLETPVK